MLVVKSAFFRPTCTACNERPANIQMHGYAEKDSLLLLCTSCALQLVRKLSEDLCESLTGDRHG